MAIINYSQALLTTILDIEVARIASQNNNVMRWVLSRGGLYLHDCLYLLKMARTKILRINSDIHRQRQWIIGQVAVGVAKEDSLGDAVACQSEPEMSLQSVG
jgi:GTP:adenosylcobinamide-phosphate guanylyltransferase